MSRRGEGRKAWFFAYAKKPSSFKNHSKLNTIREEFEAFIETLRSEVGNKNGTNFGPVYEYSSLQDEIIAEMKTSVKENGENLLNNQKMYVIEKRNK